jgi:hypothetical protein
MDIIVVFNPASVALAAIISISPQLTTSQKLDFKKSSAHHSTDLQPRNTGEFI